MTHRYYVSNMSCGKCKSHVEKALSQVDGVEHVTVDLEREQAIIESDDHREVTLEDLQAALSGDDYEIKNVMDRPETV